MRVVADTNVIISMLLWGKYLERFFVLVNTRQIVLYFSPQTIDEILRVMQYPHILKQTKKLQAPIEALLDKLFAASKMVYPERSLAIISEDPSDNRILEAAVAANAAFIVSGDRHLLKLKSVENIPIVKPAEFLLRFKNQAINLC